MTQVSTPCGSYPYPKGGWVCFHCGERFTSLGAARDHFGANPDRLPACQIKAGEERGLIMALRKAEDEIDQLRQRLQGAYADVETAEARSSALLLDIHSYKAFKGCNSIRDVFNLYDSMVGRMLAAEQRENVLVEAVNNAGWQVMLRDNGETFIKKTTYSTGIPAPGVQS